MSGTPALLRVDSRCELGEGVVWCDRLRVLYWTDINGARLWRHAPDSGATQAWRLPDRLACLAPATDGRLLLGLAKGLHACDVESQLGREALSIGEVLAHVEPDVPMTRLNDGRADRNGNFVFGTKSEHPDGRRIGRFHQYSARHGVRTLALPASAIPNAIAFDAAGTRMYFCDSVDPRILCCDYDAASASVSAIRVFAALDDPDAEPDGATVDGEDALWNAQWGAGRVVRYLEDGRVERVVDIPAPRVTCCVLGGGRLYVTSARVGMGEAALAAWPGAGGLFEVATGSLPSRPTDRVVLP
ncbi:SMP-30/gluconolactonase/LRE family protein [Lysobacter sp. SG-8]|uniref:SMP-30/gluconolactonase/LRE family protein n=1 Tax=Marilutibacter penaei TaxID=2759900 RepID=A0A7W3U118_9GAMM|nr:SMP-30/gluconolactonase/LRE family protein [Lysobacter penaei]MBB1086981.1 SMP-30/gluconolactonase/LRE family protein [Lysobacter penaei]